MEPLQWLLAGLGAFLIGLSKTGLAGVGILAVTLFASAFPARGSVGVVLLLLICADVVAVAYYRRHAVWGHLWRLFPWTILGVLIGWQAMGRVDDRQVARLIGAILLILLGVQAWQRRKADPDAPAVPKHWSFTALMGLAAGFTTMVANAAGPIMILYLLAMGLPKLEFVGTGAWYFLLMNCFKVPFAADLGLINAESLAVDAALAPLAVAGALLGKRLLPHINQRLFENAALAFSALASLRLLLA